MRLSLAACAAACLLVGVLVARLRSRRRGALAVVYAPTPAGLARIDRAAKGDPSDPREAGA